MHKQSKITISREEFLELLAEKGLDIPNGVAIRGGTESWASEVDFPIVIQWEEVAKPRFSTSFRFPSLRDAEIRSLTNANKKIEAIKLVRSLTGWGLKEAKDWVDLNCPMPRQNEWR